jgi:carbamoyl-phosphate synthase large subunit
MNSFFQDNNIRIPEQYFVDNLNYPVFIKPYDGSCSVGIKIVNSKNELTEDLVSNPKNMFMQYLPPSVYDEYTIDMYYNKHSELTCLVPRKRIEIRSGEINKGVTLKNKVYNFILSKLSKISGVIGCLTLQVFVNKTNIDEIYGIEINPRFGGGYPLSYHAGANFPKWIIEEYIFNKEIPIFESWESNLLMLRYDDEVLIHRYYE